MENGIELISDGDGLAVIGESPAVERLTSLGATRLADVDEGVEFADPDGNEFRIVGA